MAGKGRAGMSAVLSQKATTQTDVAARLAFQKQLQAVTNKIHATNNIDEIMLEVSADVCALFNADRLTIYSVSEDKQSIISKVKTGLNSFKDLKLPIAEQSIAGFVAVHKKTINIRDVYDEKELKSYSPQLNFLKQVDTKTGYRTKQMLVAPVVDAQNKELIGVALAAYFDVAYEPYKADRVKPIDLMKNMSREFVESSMWVPVDDTKDGI